MATTRKTQKPVEKIVILDPNTGELTDVPSTPIPPRDMNIERDIAHEAASKRRWLRRSEHGPEERIGNDLFLCIVAAGGIAIGAVLGFFGQPHYEKHTQAATLAAAMATSIPVVNAMSVAIDPGKHVGKLTDVVITPTKGGVFKSGKGLFLSEGDGLSLTLFESTFPLFMEAYGVDKPDKIVAHLLGKTLKARGTIQSRILKDGETRLSMIVSVPGLIQILPEKP